MAENPNLDDSTRAQFRAALEKKNKRAKEGEAHEDFTPEIHKDHGPDAVKKPFRRKTG